MVSCPLRRENIVLIHAREARRAGWAGNGWWSNTPECYSDSMTELLRYELDGPVATITIDDGKVNCLSLDMLRQLNQALDEAAASGAIVLLSGRDGCFSAGFDLPVLRSGGKAAHELLSAGFELAHRVLSFPAPVLAACTGHAVAMGAFLLLSADVRIGAEGPFRFTANEVAIGMTVPHAALVILRQRLTPADFNRAAVLAEVFSPGNAVAAGFLDRVVPAADLLAVSRETAAALSQLDRPSHTATKLRARKQTLAALRAAIEADEAGWTARFGPVPAGSPGP
jgi:enoyl-CoA hydratase